MTEKTNIYSAENIEVLTGKEAVRRRPGMYIGAAKHAVEQACREFVANGIDEYLAGHVSTIKVEFLERGFRISDDGRGIPLLRDNGEFDDQIFTTLHAGSSRDNHAPHIHLRPLGCGLAPINFLAKRMRVLTWREHPITKESVQWRLDYEYGELVEHTSIQGSGSGTIIEWEPDVELLGELETRRGLIRQELWDAAHLFSGLRFEFDKEVFHSDAGLLDLAWVHHPPFSTFTEAPVPLHFRERVDDFYIEVAAASRKSDEKTFVGWVNGSRTSAGSHIDGLRRGLSNTDYAIGLVHVMMYVPTFAGPVRDKLKMPMVAEIVEEMVLKHLS